MKLRRAPLLEELENGISFHEKNGKIVVMELTKNKSMIF